MGVVTDLLEKERTEPPVLALVVLKIVTGLGGNRRVLLHHVIIHEGRAAEERETT